VHAVPPYVEATEHLPVRALIRGDRQDAVVLGRRGDRVSTARNPLDLLTTLVV
jgi:hypothetical protein